MTPRFFQKKPVTIQAVQWTGDNWEDLAHYIMYKGGFAELRHGKVFIQTLEGTMAADVNDWIICGVKGEFYPCKPDIFEETYTEVHPPMQL